MTLFEELHWTGIIITGGMLLYCSYILIKVAIITKKNETN